MSVLVRFAPSPTGALHLGGLRTALYNYLFAKKLGGKWILRIEDTDAGRAVPGAVDGIRSALEWAGLEYDYGPGIEGPHAPYFQSERLDLYHKYAHRLLDSGHAYRCFCSPDRLATTREQLARSGSNATYDKACLNLTDEEVARRVRAGEKFIVRLNDGNLPDRSNPKDLVFGALRDAHASLPTDPVLLKSDKFPTYHLASVVDDHEMGISHVLRGEEWLASLPLHLDLYASLGLKPPRFAHLPLLLNPDGTKMSKRKGDVQVMDYQRKGWEPEAVLNWLALAGWGQSHIKTLQEDTSSPSSSCSEGEDHHHHHGHQHVYKTAPDSTTVMTLPELIREFDISSLTHRRTVLDPAKLEYLNKHHLKRKMDESPESKKVLAERAHPIVKAAFPSSPYTSAGYVGDVIKLLEGRLVTVTDIANAAPYFFVDPDYNSDEATKMYEKINKKTYATVLQRLEALFPEILPSWDATDISVFLQREVDALGLKQKEYMTILRHVFTGMKAGPGMADTLQLLGKDRTFERITNAQKHLDADISQ
ncbi:hypothetical protein C8Q75DRAFT_788322 [Abortiporus biennis]|nr:hypothetical protein C8Q75DRAFT_788322 [Abortiporus biennis]